MKPTTTIIQLLYVIALNTGVSSQILASTQVDSVRDRLAESAHLSWELGTRAQALLEYDAGSYSVFSPNSLPPPATIPDSVRSAIAPVLDIARRTISNRAASNQNATGPQPFSQDGSAADPCSLGVTILLANWTGQGNVDHLDYARAARDQVDFLFQLVPQTRDGAVSHRSSDLQLWSDSVYMVPPFLAYYGVMTRNRTKLLEAYNQIKLYRNYLRDPNATANNLWKHVVLGSPWIDEGHWSTGNGWAAAGMLRVLATIMRSEYANSLKRQQVDLTNWVREIHQGMYGHLDNTYIFRNYADNNATFYDAASTALLASTVYRVSVLRNEHGFVRLAEASRRAISGPGNLSATTSSNGTQYLTADGWLRPVVNPYNVGQEGEHSPEAQAFLLLMQAAWRDWVAAGSKGLNGDGPTRGIVPVVGMMIIVLGIAVILM